MMKKIYHDNLNHTKFLKNIEEFDMEIFSKYYLLYYLLYINIYKYNNKI